MKRKKRCLVLFDKPINDEEKKNFKNLVKENYKYFYFLEYNNISIDTCKFLRRLSPDIKCYHAHYFKKPCWEKHSFNFNLPIHPSSLEDKINWAIKSADLVVSNIKNLPKLVLKANLISIN